MLPSLKLLIVFAVLAAAACGGGNTAPQDAAPAPAAGASDAAGRGRHAALGIGASRQTRSRFPIRGRPTMRCRLRCVP